MMTSRSVAPLRTAVLRVWIHEAKFIATFRNNLSGELSPCEIRLGIDRTMLSDKLHKIEKALLEISDEGFWSKLDDPLGSPPTDLLRRTYEGMMETVVSEGSALYNELLDEGEFGPFLSSINALPDGSTITIETDCALLPWEILYPRPYNKHAPSETKAAVRPEELWGYRFQIEYILLPKKEHWTPPLSEHCRADTFVSMNLNPTIDEDVGNSSYKSVEVQKRFFSLRIGSESGELWTTGEDIKKALLAESQANIIYLYCHGQSSDPFTGEGEKLVVDNDSYLEPATLDVNKNKYLAGPIVILNSCSSGAYSPLSFSTFHSKFRERRALGIVGTTLPMPATFAAAFGQKLIDDYIAGGVTIGSVLLRLRQDLLRRNNPLALFYVLQCHLHATTVSSAKRKGSRSPENGSKTDHHNTR